MDLEEMKFGEVMKLKSDFALYFGGSESNSESRSDIGICDQIGNKVLVRTYSAGVWFGTLDKKINDEIHLKNARRLWRFDVKDGICCAGISQTGINHDKSRVTCTVGLIWMKPIEIHDCTENAIQSIESAPITNKDG